MSDLKTQVTEFINKTCPEADDVYYNDKNNPAFRNGDKRIRVLTKAETKEYEKIISDYEQEEKEMEAALDKKQSDLLEAELNEPVEEVKPVPIVPTKYENKKEVKANNVSISTDELPNIPVRRV